ncbi:MAG: type VI secretion system tip protein VgrG [Myxococcales bacterium]|nr:type VI secretion system tip protein VgrG [Myxococcales bacterium]
MAAEVELFLVEIKRWQASLRVIRLHGVEAVSSLFEFRVEVASEGLPPPALIDSEARLTIDGLDGPRDIRGCVAQVEFRGEVDVGGERYAVHELLIVPWIWRLQHRVSSRIFQKKTVPEILDRVLEAAGLDKRGYRLDLSRTYQPRDYCVQYGESDLDFFNRLCEAEGIVYFAPAADKGGSDGPSGAPTLVVTDRTTSVPPPGRRAALSFGGGAREDAGVERFGLVEAMRPGKVTLRDHNLHKPGAALAAEKRADEGAEREVYEYPGGYQEAAQGELQAGLRLAALRGGARRGVGTSDSRALIPGYSFELREHHWSDFDGEYQVLRVVHRGEQPWPGVSGLEFEFLYTNEFECLPVDVPYRAPRVTPRPVVRGVQTATVVGPASEEIFTDEHGRVKLQFHWDRDGKHDEDSSCWVRVSQAWAGNAYGALFIPRIGHEVIVDFIEGDPDRPIVTGRLHTGVNKPPYDPEAHKSKSGIMSETTPGGGGFNELQFEDARGSEEIYVHAQRDMRTEVLHDATVTVRNDRTLVIERDSVRRVTGDETEAIAGSRAIKVDGDRVEEVGGAVELTIGGSRKDEVAGSMSLKVGESLDAKAELDLTLDAGDRLVLRAGGGINISTREGVKLAAAEVNIQCGGSTIVIDRSGRIKIQGASVSVEASAELKLAGASVKIN